MVYLFFALYVEAKPFLEKWKCKKQNQYTKYQVFEAENVCCVITGVGVMNMEFTVHIFFPHDFRKEKIFFVTSE